MSRIDELIAELCPEGVKFRALGELGRRNKGTFITAGRMKLIREDGGSIRVFAGGQTIADVVEKSVPAKDVVRVPSIIVKSRGHIGFTYYDRPFTHKAELWSYSINHPDVDQRFVYYYLLTQVESLQKIARATSVKLPQLGVSDTDTLRIPIPPLEVQREIVKALASFMRRIGVCEERGSGVDKVVFQTEFYQLPAPLFETTGEHTRAVLFSHRELKSMEKDDRIRACYLHACLRYVQRGFLTNASLRERFGVEEKNKAAVSRYIREAVNARMVRPVDQDAARKMMKYVPFWA